MSFYLSEEEYERVSGFRALRRSSLSSKQSTIQLFERISRRIRSKLDHYFLDHSYAATELLLYGVEHERLTWQQLRCLALNRVDYGEVFFNCGQLTLEDRFETFAVRETDTRDEYVYGLSWGYSGVDEFLSFIDAFTHSLMAGLKTSPLKLVETYRQGRVDTHYHTTQYSRHCPVASSYEASLRTQTIFQKELQHLGDRIRHKMWTYSYAEKRFSKYRLGDDPIEIDKATESFLRAFCERWCVGVLSREPETANAGVQCEAMKVRVCLSHENTGLDVFIPRFYRFSHLLNRQSDDFQCLKQSLDHLFVTYTMPKKRKSRAELMEEARVRKSRFKAQGCSKHDAWEKTRVAMSWTKNTMRKLMGQQPKSKQSGQTRADREL